MHLQLLQPGLLIQLRAEVLCLLSPHLCTHLAREVMANTTSTVGLFPGSLAGAWGSRAHLKGIKTWLLILIPPSIAGSIIGALMVTRFPQHFRLLVPWLLVLASTLFLIQPLISKPKTSELEGEGNPSKSLFTVLGIGSISVFGCNIWWIFWGRHWNPHDCITFIHGYSRYFPG